MRKIAYTVRTMMSPLSITTMLMVTLLRTVTSYPFQSSGSLAELMMSLYGGVEWDMFITFQTIAGWIIFLLPYLFGIVHYFSLTMEHHLRLTLYRFHDRTSWWTSEMLALVLFILLMTGLSVVFSLLIGFGFGLRGLTMYQIDSTGFYHASRPRWLLAPVMAGMNVLLWTELYAGSYLVLRDSRISTFLYLVPSVLLLLQYSNEERTDRLSSVLNWSMVRRYALLAENGVSEVQCVARFMLVVCIVWIICMIAAACVRPFERTAK